jgi:DNA-binding CsgD family transcriptional regulator
VNTIHPGNGVTALPVGQLFPRANRSRTVARTLGSLAELEFRLGDWQSAYASAVESLRLAQDSGDERETPRGLARVALVEAGLGRAAACRSHGKQALRAAERQGDRSCIVLARTALGLLELGLGRADDAVGWLEPLRRAGAPVAQRWLPDLAEAFLRAGDSDQAADAVAAMATGTSETRPFPLREALDRCRGLLAAEHQFEAHFVRALECSPSLGEPFELARTELCFGQRLRRAGRRVAARRRLRSALDTFERLDAIPWAETARRELGASGQRARKRCDESRDELTPQEDEIARIVARGATNREVAAQLFVSPKTVETHLSHIYRKLGVRSRTELARAFERRAPEARAVIS